MLHSVKWRIALFGTFFVFSPETRVEIHYFMVMAGSSCGKERRYDEESWTDDDTGKVRTSPVVIVDEIEYSYSRQKDGKSGESQPFDKEEENDEPQPPASDTSSSQPGPETPPAAPDNFAGFHAFGGGPNPFF